MKRNQRGITLLGFIILLAVVGVFLYVGMKVVPMYMEFYSVKRSLADMAKESDIAQADPATIRDRFNRRMNVSYVENIQSENIKFARNDRGLTVIVQYEVRRPLIGNLDVVGRFKAEQEMRKAAGD
ncbi:DUF4845 domain-containing protein [Pseudomonas sp. CGJS7]|uniref:DUF4845 domain-containing protein n=1 Tax=Pseudomonas sp. CGJS7 TaxID=3109348 RepID=UPI0030082377